MKRFLCILATIVICLALVPHAVAQDAPETFFQKVETGQPATALFYGGSITMGAKASNYGKTSWPALTGQWLKENWPAARITVINKSIGGSGSVHGVMRMDRDLLPHKPDLVFIEFAVNDVGSVRFAGKEITQGCLEILVRKLKQANPGVTVFLVITAYKDTKRVNQRALHEEVAKHYDLPLIDLQTRYNTGAENGEIDPDTFMGDYVHPADAGHRGYADWVIEALKAHDKTDTPRPDKLPKPM
ncbi:MAG: acyl-CoA thioesterase-1 [Verrucomicrobiales bacterium]|jgi:acyl-CoA thioesterase-1